MNRISAGIKSACKAVNTKIDSVIDGSLNVFGLKGYSYMVKPMIKRSVGFGISTFFVSKIIYPSLKPHILQLIPDVDLSYKAIKSLENTAKIGNQMMKDFGIVAPLVAISYTMGSQAKNKLISDGYKFIKAEAEDETDLNIDVKKPSYEKSVDDKINDFEKIITNTTVRFKKKSENGENTEQNEITPFLFYGLPGTGKSSIMTYLASKFKAAVKKKNENAKVVHYKINKAKSPDEKTFSWQLEQIIHFINNQTTDIPLLTDEFNAANNGISYFDKSKDAIIIELDEIDQLGKTRQADLQLFYDKLTKSKANILFMGATNFKDSVPEAVQSRIHNQLEIGLPDKTQRDSILRDLCADITELQVGEQNITITDNQLFNLLQASKQLETDNILSGRDIKNTFEQTLKEFCTKIVEKQSDYIENNQLKNTGLKEITEMFNTKLQEVIENKKKKTNT